jgi:primase-polymerase (primpol)-like protein
VLGDGWSGIDLDNCVNGYDPNTGGLGASTPHVGPYLQVLDHLPTYWELSPSGKGYKAYGRGPRYGGEIKFNGEDAPVFVGWQAGRFFAVTGHYQCPDAIADIAHVIESWFPSRT